MTAAADRIVHAIADQLGDTTGRCPVCLRLWRLVHGLVPLHGTGTRGGWCQGSEQEPKEE